MFQFSCCRYQGFKSNVFLCSTANVRCDLHLFFLQIRKSIKHRQLSFQMPSTLYKSQAGKGHRSEERAGKESDRGSVKGIFTANRPKDSCPPLYLTQIFMTTLYTLLTSGFSPRNPYFRETILKACPCQLLLGLCQGLCS